ncbi:MAG: carboxypeptidase-like regulatory domain-containing protein [Planctomycetota bacterium]
MKLAVRMLALVAAAALALLAGRTLLGGSRASEDGVAARPDAVTAAPARAPTVDELPAAPAGEARRAAAEVDVETAPTASRYGPEAPAEEPPPKPLLVRGLVVDAEGEPIEGARLVAAELGTTLATADADGRLDGELALSPTKIRALSPRLVRALVAEVRAEGFATAALDLDLRPGGTLELGTVELALGTVLVGTVREEHGGPAPGVAISWWPEEAFPEDAARARVRGPFSRGAQQAPARATSDEEGAFTLAGVPRAPGFLAGRNGDAGWGWSTVVTPLDAGPARVELVVPPPPPRARVAGRVLLPDGAPAPGARLELFDREMGFDWRQGIATADADGAFAFTVEAGWTGGFVRALDTEGRYAPAEVDPVSGGEEKLVLQLGAARFTELRLRDPDGAAVSWGHVRSHDAVPQLTLTPTDEAGGLRIQVPQRPFTINAYAPGFRTERFGPFDPAAVGDTLTLTLIPGEAVRGTVIADGQPVEGARIAVVRTFPAGVAYAREVAPPDRPFAVLASGCFERSDATTGPDGRFVATLHNDGRHTLRVWADGYPPLVAGPFQWSRDEGAAGLVLELQGAGAIEGTVRTAPGRSVAGMVVAASNGWGVAWTTSVDDEGRFRLEGLAPGSWQVRRARPPVAAAVVLRGRDPSADRRAEWDGEVRAGATTRIDLDLRDEGAFRFRGTLRVDGTGPKGFVARLLAPGSRAAFGDPALAEAAVDADGSFELAVSAGGAHLIELAGHDLLVLQPVTLARGVTTWEAEFDTGEVRLSGTAPLRPDGSPHWAGWLRVETPDGLVALRTVDLRGLPDELLVDRVPAGSAALVLSPEGKHRSLGAYPAEAWEEIARTAVGAGEAVALPLP